MNINQRLEGLRSRRSGMVILDNLDFNERLAVLAKSLTEEPWQMLAKAQPYTAYAQGAMKEVTPDYTRISLETAERVGRQLQTRLTNAGISVEFRLQGSVPLNVHIRGVSDVDLLTFDVGFLTYATGGSRSRQGLYKNPTTRTSIDVLAALRREAEKALAAAFPAATVDTSGAKAIKITGGSLVRPVDVVPSHWNDTIDYQTSAMEHDRGVTILNKVVPETIDNLPFVHIKRISDRCDATLGSLRKAIRLCKNVKADAEKEGAQIALPSFDIAATMYHANQHALLAGCKRELAILAETQRHLDALACNHEHAKTLMVPDGSRSIFDTAAKLSALNRLSVEMDDLARAVAKEHDRRLAFVAESSLADSRTTLASIYLAPA